MKNSLKVSRNAALLILTTGLLFFPGCKQRNKTDSQAELNIDIIEIKNDLERLKQENTMTKARLSNFEELIRSRQEINNSQVENTDSEDTGNSFIIENIVSSNIDTKTAWNQTNKANLYVVSVKLEKEPYPNSILVWTGKGLLPFSAYKTQGLNMSIMFNQSKEDFISSNNFINIRYIPKRF